MNILNELTPITTFLKSLSHLVMDQNLAVPKINLSLAIELYPAMINNVNSEAFFMTCQKNNLHLGSNYKHKIVSGKKVVLLSQACIKWGLPKINHINSHSIQHNQANKIKKLYYCSQYKFQNQQYPEHTTQLFDSSFLRERQIPLKY